MSIGAGIVLWYYDEVSRQPILLVGKESKYVSDLINDNEEFGRRFGELILSKQELDDTSYISEQDNLRAAKKEFSRRALELESQLGLGIIKFDAPEKSERGYKVNFRYLPRVFKRGIIKGGTEGSETPLQTVLREVGEEIGINIPESEEQKMKNLGDCEGYTMFSLNIGKKARDVFLSRIQERLKAKSGEIYEFSFKTLSEIDSLLSGFNKKSQCAINKFKEQILPTISRGGRKTRRQRKIRQTKIRRQRKTRKSKTGRDKTRRQNKKYLK